MSGGIEQNTFSLWKKVNSVFVHFSYKTGYVADMMDLIFDEVFVDPTPYTDAVLAIPVPEDLAAQFERPNKEEVIAGYVSRFNQAAVWIPRSDLWHQETPFGFEGPHKLGWQPGFCVPASPNTSSQRIDMQGTCNDFKQLDKKFSIAVTFFCFVSHFIFYGLPATTCGY